MARIKKTTRITSAAEPKPVAAASPISSSSNGGAPAVNIEEYIRRRAYELYLERGGHEGFAEQDWLRAESEVRHKTGQRSA